MNSQTARLDQSFRDQPSLFDQPVTPPVPVSVSQQRGRDSRNAQHDSLADEMPDRRKFVLAMIHAAGVMGTTLDEISQATGRPANSFSGRVTELVQSGHVVRTEQRRPTKSGGTASVLVASEFFRSFQTLQTQEQDSMSTTMSRTNEQPDGLTRSDVPRDQFDEPLECGVQYRIGKTRVLCFEAEDGELYVQKCYPIGALDPDSRPQHVLTMPPGKLQIERINADMDDGDDDIE